MGNYHIASSDLPEVVPNQESPEVVHMPDGLHPYKAHDVAAPLDSSPMKEGNYAYNSAYTYPASERPQTVLPGESPEVGEGKATRRPFGWSKRRVWIVIVIVVLAIVAIVVGATVGALAGKNDSNSKDDEETSPSAAPSEKSDSPPSSTSSAPFGTPTSFSEELKASDSTCYEKVCPAVVSIVRQNTKTSSFFVFGRGSKGAFSYRESNGVEWTSKWEPLGGSFLGQPAVVNTNPGRLDIFGVAENDQSMLTRTYVNNTWADEWESLGGICYSAPSVSAPLEARLALFTLNRDNKLATRVYRNGEWTGPGWNIAQSSSMTSSPITSGGDGVMDVLGYGERNQLMTKHQNATRYTAWLNSGGSFRGDPVVGRDSPDTTVFFGIGTDSEMYYSSWVDRDTTLEKNLTSLGGEFESVPSLLISGDSNGRIDVVAVGLDGKLKHNAVINGDEGGKWQDLGGFFNSAPSVVRLSEDKVAVFGIGPDGDMIHGVWETSDERDWGKGEWFRDGGDLSSAWFRAD